MNLATLATTFSEYDQHEQYGAFIHLLSIYSLGSDKIRIPFVIGAHIYNTT